MREGLKSADGGSQTRSFHTHARRRAEELRTTPASEAAVAVGEDFGAGDDAVEGGGVGERGHKYGLPTLPLASNAHLKYRYDPVVEQATNELMRDGKKSVAQRVRRHSPV